MYSSALFFVVLFFLTAHLCCKQVSISEQIRAKQHTRAFSPLPPHPLACKEWIQKNGIMFAEKSRTGDPLQHMRTVRTVREVNTSVCFYVYSRGRARHVGGRTCHLLGPQTPLYSWSELWLPDSGARRRNLTGTSSRRLEKVVQYGAS